MNCPLQNESVTVRTINRRRSARGCGPLWLRGSSTRAALFDRLVDYVDRMGWPEQIIAVSKSVPDDQNLADRDNVVDRGTTSREGPVDHLTRTLNMQEIVDAVVRALQDRPCMEQRRIDTATSRPDTQATNSSMETHSGSNYNWGQIKFMSKLIPPFAGKEEENVTKWIERISSMARLHNISDGVLILAAVNQLRDRVLEWYNRQPVDSVAIWENFKYKLRRYFERKETYTTLLSKITSRIWRAHSEKFVDYAEDKLKLMQLLTLTEREKIDLLAEGVREPLFRGLVLNSRIQEVPEFIEHVRKMSQRTVF